MMPTVREKAKPLVVGPPKIQRASTAISVVLPVSKVREKVSFMLVLNVPS